MDDSLLATKAKGVPKMARRRLTMAVYRACLTSLREIRVHCVKLQPKEYRMYLRSCRRTALSTYDCKRYLWPCGIHSCPYGSRLIVESVDGSCPFCGHTVEQMRDDFRVFSELTRGE